MKLMIKIIILSALLQVSSVFAATVTETFLDTFSSRSYSNNDGTKNFASNWEEIEPYASNNDPKNGYIYIVRNTNVLHFYYIYSETISRSLDLSGASTVTLTFDLVNNNLSGDIQDVQMLNENDIWTTVISIDQSTATGTLTYTLAPEFIHASSAIRFIARDDWQSSDSVDLDNVLFTVTYEDSDNDGVQDNNDVDDDNDGILDIDEESSVQTDTYSNGDGGGTHTYSYAFTDRSTVTIDLQTLNNAFNLVFDGTTLLTNGNILDSVATTGRSQLVFVTTGGSAGVVLNNPETANTNGLPRVRVYIDESGVASVYGTRTTTSTFLEIMNMQDGSTFNTFTPSSGWKDITVSNPDDSGTDALSATNTVSINIDNDGDGVVNSKDLDSDNDGIPDNVEAQQSTLFIASSTPASVRTDGSNSAYSSTGLTPVDTDGDGIPDYADTDSDGDTVTDCVEGLDDAVAVGKSCPITVGIVGSNGLASWSEPSDDYIYVSGNIVDPLSDLQDEISGNSEAAYREIACGTAETVLTAFQWKTISMPCNTGTNDISTLFGASLGTYGEPEVGGHWVMYQQGNTTYSGGAADTVKLTATSTVEPGRGYWIITDQNVTAKIAKPLANISQTTTEAATNYSGVSGTAFEQVMRYDLPSSDSVNVKKVMIGNPFLKKFQLSDVFYENTAVAANYVSIATLITGDAMEPVVYTHDSNSSDPYSYIAITPDTPGFTDEIAPMLGYWVKLNAGNTNTNTITFPFEK